MPIPLTPSEEIRLAFHETIVEAKMQSFLEASRALRAIRDRELYLSQYSSFDEYCQAQLGQAAETVNQILALTEGDADEH